MQLVFESSVLKYPSEQSIQFVSSLILFFSPLQEIQASSQYSTTPVFSSLSRT